MREPGGGWRATTGVRTRPNGRFTAFTRVGPTRRLRFVYYAFGDSERGIDGPALRHTVRAPVRVRARRSDGIVRIHGRVTGGRVPRGGALVELQRRTGARWRGVGALRTAPTGRFTARLRTAGGGPLRLRALVPAQRGLPFAAGRSRTVMRRRRVSVGAARALLDPDRAVALNEGHDRSPAAAVRPVPRGRPRAVGGRLGAGAPGAGRAGPRRATAARSPARSRARLEDAGVEVHDRSEGVELLASSRALVKSPGVPQEAAVVMAARAAGMPVVGEVELGWRLVPNEFVAVTGSNGKTTTAELIGHVHREAGVAVEVAGNVGIAITTLAGSVAPEAAIVCEVSSFQLEDTERFAPEAAVLLNLAEDHLDRHGSFEAYRAAKLEAFARQPPGTIAVLPQGVDAGGEARRVRFGRGPGADLSERGGRLWWFETPLIDVEEIRLRGVHNRENAMAAAAVCLARGIEPDAVRAGLRSFGGVAHRLEEIATLDGVLYVNDSKATNVASATVGIESFAGGVHVILGGRGKGSDYAPLAEPVARRASAAYLIGETAAELHAALEATGVPLHHCGDLEHAVAAARAAARPGEVVLLSPACTSYDQYRSYEERGEHFRALVTAG